MSSASTRIASPVCCCRALMSTRAATAASPKAAHAAHSIPLVFMLVPLFLQHAGRIPFDHVIGRGTVADVPDAVHLVRRLENHRAGTHAPGDTVDQRLDGALFDDHDLFIGMLVRRMRCL